MLLLSNNVQSQRTEYYSYLKNRLDVKLNQMVIDTTNIVIIERMKTVSLILKNKKNTVYTFNKPEPLNCKVVGGFSVYKFVNQNIILDIFYTDSGKLMMLMITIGTLSEVYFISFQVKYI